MARRAIFGVPSLGYSGNESDRYLLAFTFRRVVDVASSLPLVARSFLSVSDRDALAYAILAYRFFSPAT
jgi:hypothetical protein